MIILRNFDSYKSIHAFHLTNGKLIEAQSLGMGKDSRISGHFVKYDDIFFAVYKSNGVLYFTVNEMTAQFSENIMITVNTEGRKKTLSVSRKGQTFFKQEYVPTNWPRYKNDLTQGVDEEDFDFGLFLSNLSKSSKRQDVLLETLN